MNCAFTFVMLAPLLPLLFALGIAVHVLQGAGTVMGDDAEPPTARLALVAAWGALLTLLGLDALALLEGSPGHFVVGQWFSSGRFVITIAFLLDGLSLGFATLVAAIAVVVLRFSRHYLHREPGFHRFFLLMLLFLAGMLLIVLAGNLVIAFVGWELCGVSSWLLIGYAYERPVATGNGLYAFVTNRIGDAGFLLGLCLAAWWLGSFEWPALAAWSGQAGFDKVQARLLLFGFMLAAVAKSAQFPLSAWIGRALEGPTPSSAIFYGAVMVHAGVYLVIRFAPVLTQVPDIMVYLALIGSLTALYGWLGGLVQTDVKSRLVFATSTQVGLMFLTCGLGWFELAAWHMGLHAAWRAWQFLLAPSYMHLMDGRAPPAPDWLRRFPQLHTAAQQRFWLEPLARSLLIRPVLTLGRDMRALDDKVLASIVGMPPQLRVTRDDETIRAHGLAGRLLWWLAETCQRLEYFLVVRGGDTRMRQLLRQAGEYLRVFEALLEHPRYLVLAVALTFAVIL